MKLKELDKYLKDLLKINEISDSSLNGIQIGDEEREIKKIAFAVDANLRSMEKAVGEKADLLIVHHGVFWRTVFPFTGANYEKMRILVENKIALYAIHLPLDLHNPLGNNFQIAGKLGLKNMEQFGNYHDVLIGFSGDYPYSFSDLEKQCRELSQTVKMIVHRPERFERIAVISGNGGSEIFNDFIESDKDLLITGEIGHIQYCAISDWKLNVISLGHYESEKYGLLALGDHVRKELGMEFAFINEPTGY